MRTAAGRGLLNRAVIVGCLFVAGAAYGYFIHRDHIFPYKIARAALLPPPSTDLPQSPWFQARYGVISAFPVRAAVAMVGDSITEAADWRAILPGVDVVNQGIGGDTTAGLLKRIDLVKRTGAQTVALMFGINDLVQGQSVEQIYPRYTQAIGELAEPGKCVIVQSTLLTSMKNTALNSSIAALNAKMKAYCKGGKCVFLDLNAKLTSDGELPAEATVDGIHPTPAVYAIWRDMFVPYLASCGR